MNFISGRISRQNRIPGISGILTFLFFAGLYANCFAAREAEERPSDTLVLCRGKSCGAVELAAPQIRVERLRLRCPDLVVLDYTGKGGYGADEEWSLELTDFEEGYYFLNLQAEKGSVRREIEYVFFSQGEKKEGEAAVSFPVIATERAVDMDTDSLLYRRQTLDIAIKCECSEKKEPQLERTLNLALDDTELLVSTEVIDILTDFLWHHQGLDSPPGSYNGILRLLDRRIELDPMEISQYADAAWLWWSKWVSWDKDPERMPDGKKGVEEALDVLKKGRAANPRDARYYFEAAMTMNSLARYHLPEKYEFVEAYLIKAEEFAAEEPKSFRIRVRKSLAHLYRHREMNEEAINWYEKVLELDPESEVASRYLERLSRD